MVVEAWLLSAPLIEPEILLPVRHASPNGNVPMSHGRDGCDGCDGTQLTTALRLQLGVASEPPVTLGPVT